MEAFCLRLEQSLVDIPRIIQCMASECGSDCTENSDICIGGLHRKHKRTLMGERKQYLSPQEKSLRAIIITKKKTSFQALMVSMPSSSTQINEGTKRSILKYWPKNVTYMRTARARAKRRFLKASGMTLPSKASIRKAMPPKRCIAQMLK